MSQIHAATAADRADQYEREADRLLERIGRAFELLEEGDPVGLLADMGRLLDSFGYTLCGDELRALGSTIEAVGEILGPEGGGPC